MAHSEYIPHKKGLKPLVNTVESGENDIQNQDGGGELTVGWFIYHLCAHSGFSRWGETRGGIAKENFPLKAEPCLGDIN